MKNKLLIFVIIGILIIVIILVIIFYNNKCNFRNPDKCDKFCIIDNDCVSSCCGCINKKEVCNAKANPIIQCELEFCKCINNLCEGE